MACTLPALGQPSQLAQAAISAGRTHNLGLAVDGSVFWWGTEPGLKERLDKRVAPTLPQRVQGLPPAVVVAAGWEHSSAIARDGGVYEWGFSPYRVRQVEMIPRIRPCTVAALIGGGHAKDPCRESDLALGARMYAAQPIRIPGLPPAIAIAAGDKHTAIVSRSGEVYCWGPDASPRKIGGLERIKAIALGQTHGVALRADGVVFGWGPGTGQGISYRAKEATDLCANPNPQPFFTGAIAIAAGTHNSYALRADGSVWAWGWPWNGNSSIPKQANPDGIPEGFLARRIATLAAAVGLGGGDAPSALTRQGRAVSWKQEDLPELRASLQAEASGIAALSSFRSILALRADGFVCVMGDNRGGVVLPGDESAEITRFVPLPLGGGKGLLNLVDPGRAAPADLCAAR